MPKDSQNFILNFRKRSRQNSESFDFNFGPSHNGLDIQEVLLTMESSVTEFRTPPISAHSLLGSGLTVAEMIFY